MRTWVAVALLIAWSLVPSAWAVTPPLNHVVSAGTLFEDFETFGDWTCSGPNGGSNSADSTNVKTGTQALYYDVPTIAGTTYRECTKAISFVATNAGIFGVWVYLPTMEPAFASKVDMYISSSTSFTSYFSLSLPIWNAGWNFMVFPRADFSTTGGENWSNTMVRLRMRIQTINGSTQNAHASIDSLYYGIYGRPKAVIQFDDGYDDVIDIAYAYMAPRGLQATVFVNSDTIGSSASYMTVSELATLRDAGWDISNHTSTHVDLTTLGTQSAMESNIAVGRAWLVSSGFTRAPDYLAYPYGGYNPTVKAAALAQGVVLARTTSIGYNAPLKGLAEPLAIGKKGMCNTESLAMAKLYVDQAIKNGSTVFLLFHYLVTTPTICTEWATADFQALIDYLIQKSNEIDVVSISEWYLSQTTGRRPR